MKKSMLFILLCSLTAVAAGDPKECKKDCKEFVVLCENGCDTQLKKKDPKGKVLGACKKNCSDFIKQCEKGCENGEF